MAPVTVLLCKLLSLSRLHPIRIIHVLSYGRVLMSLASTDGKAGAQINTDASIHKVPSVLLTPGPCNTRTH